MKNIDAKGKACPIPVVMTKKEIDAGETNICVEVDNAMAKENVTKLATAMAYDIDITEIDGGFALLLSKNGSMPNPAAAEALTATAVCPTGSHWAIFAGRDIIGSGDRDLGSSLIKMFFYVLGESDDLPAEILLMNDGVKLAVIDEAIIEHLQNLAAKGVEILVCGTCLDYYNLSGQLKVGSVSNMFEILGRMQAADKVVSL